MHATAVLGGDDSVAQVGALFGAATLMGFLGAPLGGFLADRLGRNAVIIPSSIGVSIAAVVTALPIWNSFELLLVPIMFWYVLKSITYISRKH